MRLARVMGNVVATHKHGKLEGAKLLLVQPLTARGAFQGTPLLAVDTAQAGIGESVLIVLEGRAAVSALRRRAAPVDAAIVGIVDEVHCDDHSTPGRGVLTRSRAGGHR